MRARLARLDDRGWHAVLRQLGDASIDQTWTYAHLRFRRARLGHAVVERGGRPVAAAQVLELGLPLGGLAVVKFGPLLHSRGRDVEAARALLRSLVDHYVGRRQMTLRVIPPPARAADTGALLAEAGFTPLDAPSRRYIVPLPGDRDALLGALKPRWRRLLRKGWRQEMVATEDRSPDALARFLPLYDRMQRRKDFHDTSGVDVLERCFQQLPADLRPRIFSCARGGEVLATAVVSSIGDTAVYWFGASEAPAVAGNAGYVLHFHVAETLQAEGATGYDLGGDLEDEGLAQFKRGMVGAAGDEAAAVQTWVAPGARVSRALLRAAERARDVIRGARAAASSPAYTAPDRT